VKVPYAPGTPEAGLRLGLGVGVSKQNLKAITRKTAPYSFDERVLKLKEVQRGWVNYFRMASIFGKLKDLDGWIRNRLRYCIWHDWNRAKRAHEHH